MEDARPALDFLTFAWRLLATLCFVLVNAFFVAAEFALVKVRDTQLESRAAAGSGRAAVARHILGHLDHYLSACQLGITIASLILGWLAEPAVAELLLALAPIAGLALDPADPLLHGVALGVALAVVTALHMTLGEQAPKLWAIQRAEATALAVAYPLRVFADLFRPLIWALNGISNGLLRLGGLSAEELSEVSSHSADEIKRILATAARAGQITARELELAKNVMDMIELEVRHILVPRVDVVLLSLQYDPEENLRIVRESGHSRFPLCEVGLDTVIGVVHAKEVLAALVYGSAPDLRKLARRPLFVSDTQPLARLIRQLQQSGNHCCVVVDEHGTTIGLAFLEDALEEIVGPIHDEFDQAPPGVEHLSSGAIEMPGSLALPEAAQELRLHELELESDTIGGLVVAELGRLPRKGDQVEIGPWRVTVTSVVRRRIERLHFEPLALRDSRSCAPGTPRSA
jgi:CBS domain containing-hemolysin-like protein